MAQAVKNLPAVWETWFWSLGREDPLEKGMGTHSSVLAWRIPWINRGAWQATVHGVTESDTTEQLTFPLWIKRIKWLILFLFFLDCQETQTIMMIHSNQWYNKLLFNVFISHLHLCLLFCVSLPNDLFIYICYCFHSVSHLIPSLTEYK